MSKKVLDSKILIALLFTDSPMRTEHYVLHLTTLNKTLWPKRWDEMIFLRENYIKPQINFGSVQARIKQRRLSVPAASAIPWRPSTWKQWTLLHKNFLCFVFLWNQLPKQSYSSCVHKMHVKKGTRLKDIDCFTFYWLINEDWTLCTSLNNA